MSSSSPNEEAAQTGPLSPGREALTDVKMLRNVWKEPVLVAKSEKFARPDQQNPHDASEYLDDHETLVSKARAIAHLLRQSKHCVVYTGAGISKSSGISDYATRAVGSVAGTSAVKLRNPFEAQPTPAHDALASMYRAGYVKEFINQNHDGLFEKAGVAVSHSNLIHGDWYDPANIVVQFSGNLRGDLFERLLRTEKTADLVLVGGTSLSGMNADRVAQTCAKRFARGESGILGTILVNLQKTCLDEACTVRVWARTDDFFSLLAQELGVTVESVRVPRLDSDMFAIGYGPDGTRLPPDDDRKYILDLSPGAELRIANPAASNFNAIYIVQPERDREGNWVVLRKPSIDKNSPPRSRLTLGRWYVAAALRGEISQLPLVSAHAQLVTTPAAS